MAKVLLFSVFLMTVFGIVGCDVVGGIDVVKEVDETHYQRGERLLREGREQEALAAFLKVVEKRRDASESHLYAGQLYDTYIGDPIAAIYHYRKFLELNPEGQKSTLVRQMIDTAKKKFARQLPGQPLNGEFERLDLLDMLEEMRKENEALKLKLANLQARLERSNANQDSQPLTTLTMNLNRLQAPGLSPNSGSQPSSQTPSNSAETRTAPESYTVVSGDTLSKISTKVYGSSTRFMDIFQANRDVMANPNHLKVGQVLRIP